MRSLLSCRKTGRPRCYAWTLAAALALPAQSAGADESAESRVTIEALATAIAAWTATALDQPLPEPPRIERADAGTMTRLRYGSAAEGGPGLEVVALYDDARRTILLPEGWSGATPTELSVLVHETVHHMQNLSGRTYECPAAREAEAYEIQARWLGLFGRGLDTEFDLNKLTLFVLSRCGLR